jgi:aryl-alcohol dehydrogenase-like predicted oxidoreductase
MTQYSLLDRRPEVFLQSLQENNISVVVRGALAQGLLAGKPERDYLDLKRDEVKKIADSINHSSQKAIQFVLNQPAVASAVIGIRTKEQLNDIIAGL